MIRPAQGKSLSVNPSDQLRIYFVSKDNRAWPPGSAGASYPTREKGFTIDWRGCGGIITADAGYSVAALDLHRFSGHPTAMIVLPSEQFRLWHDNLREAFMPKAGGYAIDDITRHIGETSRLLVRQQIPSDLQARFAPQAEMDQWFGKSHVLDDRMLPLLMYRAATEEQINTGKFGPGPTWFAGDGLDAHAVGEGPELAEALLSIQNPLTLTSDADLHEITPALLIPGEYDGIIIRGSDGLCRAAAAASPEQYRVTGDCNPDIGLWLASWRWLQPAWQPAATPDIDDPIPY